VGGAKFHYRKGDSCGFTGGKSRRALLRREKLEDPGISKSITDPRRNKNALEVNQVLEKGTRLKKGIFADFKEREGGGVTWPVM